MRMRIIFLSILVLITHHHKLKRCFQSEVRGDLREMESKLTGRTIQSRSDAYKDPTAEEIEEFFLADEKIVAHRFKEKSQLSISTNPQWRVELSQAETKMVQRRVGR